MEFDLSKTQKLIQESARTFFQRECPLTKVRQLMESETAFDESLWNGIAEQGWTGLIVPEEYEGLGLGLVELAALGEEMGRACLPGPFLSTLWASALVAESDNRDYKCTNLPAMALGGKKAAVALLENDPTWRLDGVRLEAVSREGGLVLNGSKILVPDAAVADYILVAARHGSDLVIASLPADASGMSVTSSPGLDATRKLYRIDFDDVAIADDQVLARGDRATTALEKSIRAATVLTCAELVGGMQWIIETTVEYARTRHQFDKPIGSFQAVQHRCADMLMMIESARSATYYAAWTLTENDPASERALSMAKAYCSDAGREVGNSGIQIHGGIGFTWEHDLHLYYRRATANELLFGDATFHREHLAKLII